MYTKITTMTWGSAQQWELTSAAWHERLRYIESEQAQGNTDGLAVQLNETTWRRVWTNQIAADNWSTFISNLATGCAATVDVVITDNVI